MTAPELANAMRNVAQNLDYLNMGVSSIYVRNAADTIERQAKELAHWKANHDEMVNRNELLRMAAWGNTNQPHIIQRAVEAIVKVDRLEAELELYKAQEAWDELIAGSWNTIEVRDATHQRLEDAKARWESMNTKVQ